MSCTHHQYYKNNQIKENNMDGTGRSHGKEEKWIVVSEKPDKKRSVGRISHRWQDIKMDLK